ncbi:unnamed protein product [Adineta ricciae]|uniref:C2H2-type domain-containing protein n=1 Tax=Adineta ricciae TaxID=249248 RepID=A0A815ADI6_ADIRI|nr:unnamed protein product [Adineta ricciae]CAF1254452.1 unnamed protein product [Adineta ricciae]
MAPNRTVLRQLYLFDCDGGRSSIFNDNSALMELPNNCELHLFWNSHDSNINALLYRLKDNQQLRLHATSCTNNKNAADGLLIYHLGKLISEFEKIVIVHGGDTIFDEVIEETKIGSHKVNSPHPDELRKLIGDMKKFNQDNLLTTNNVQSVPENPVQILLSNTCPKCNKKRKTILGTVQHMMVKHHLNNSDIVNLGVRNGARYLDLPVTTNTTQSAKSNINTTERFKCTHTTCSSKMKTFKTKKALQDHCKSKHPDNGLVHH